MDYSVLLNVSKKDSTFHKNRCCNQIKQTTLYYIMYTYEIWYCSSQRGGISVPVF